MSTPTYSQIVTAFNTVMAQVVGRDAIVLSPWQDGDPKAGNIFVIHAVTPRETSGGELGGRPALAVQAGVYMVTLSYPGNDGEKYTDAQAIAQRLVDTFYRFDIPVADGWTVYAGDPYITNVGATPDDRRALSVTVPYRAWAGGYEENTP